MNLNSISTKKVILFTNCMDAAQEYLKIDWNLDDKTNLYSSKDGLYPDLPLLRALVIQSNRDFVKKD